MPQSVENRRNDMKLPIYLDYSATTPVDPRVLDRMLPFLRGSFGNPASRSHSFGWEAEAAVEQARTEVAELVNADPRRDHLDLRGDRVDQSRPQGCGAFLQDKGRHLVTVTTEHKATLDTMRELEREGFEVTYLDVAADGLSTWSALAPACGPTRCSPR
jgi:cysteine desulfurase